MSAQPGGGESTVNAKIFKYVCSLCLVIQAHSHGAAWAEQDIAWNSQNHFRLLLAVDAKGRKRSNSPAAVAVDFQQALRVRGATGNFDEHTVEVMTRGGERVAHRVEKLFGATATTLHFVVPDETQTNFAVYFDTAQSRRGEPKRYHGLIGDGDRFVEEYGRREIAASHFDCFVDFDGDGDLDLFKGGVEPFIYCYENLGRNRLVDRGRLASGGQVFQLPRSRSNRSWVTVAFFDIDGDGDQDFFPSFGDGPDTGKIVTYRNTTGEHGGQLTFTRIGPLETASGTALASGAQAGGWFPSIHFIHDFDGDGVGPDALVGSNHRAWLYRAITTNKNEAPGFADAVALHAGGKEIVLTNPRFDCADIDGDGDLDLFAGTQPGAVYWFKNIGTPNKPEFAPGVAVAWSGKYLIGDAHSGVKVADFDADGLLDIASGRFWERADLNAPDAPHDFGGFFKNVGTRSAPKFKRHTRGGPFTEGFQLCDAVRQNGVRAADWNHDGRLDLLAGDTDGFIWLFRNQGDRSLPVFDTGERVRAAGQPLSAAATGGHARFDVCDWNNDERKDIVVADGNGTVTLFLNQGSKSKAALAKGVPLRAGGKPIQVGGRASVSVCDWNNDERKDLLLADDKGYYFSENIGRDAEPLLNVHTAIQFGGKKVSYVRPNLGSLVDWDGDGKRDFIGGHFENSIRFYRNTNTGTRDGEPAFTDPEGVTIVQGESPQMISGADAIDWNGDGDIDILTGQGHGGSGLRFYERDWIEDELRGTHPKVTIVAAEVKGR